MSEFVTLRITRAEPEGTGFEVPPEFESDWLHLTQVPYQKPSMNGTGFIDWVNDHKYGFSLGSVLQLAGQYQSACEDDGCLTVELQVRRSRANLSYTLKATYGELSSKMVHSTGRQESVTVSQTDELDLETNIVGSVTAEWEGDVIGVDGSVLTPPPVITQEGSLLTWPVVVYAGVIRLSYGESYDTYTLTITPRGAGDYEADNREGAYHSTVFALWGGGIETLEIDIPEMEGNCGNSTIIKPPDEGEGEGCFRRNILVDPCTKEVLDEWLEQMACPEDPEDPEDPEAPEDSE